MALHPKRVLVVDDSKSVVAAVEGILAPLGFEVFGASDAQEGVLQFEKLDPGIVLMDLEMPGQDGLAAVRKIRALESKRSEKTRVIMLTANNKKEVVSAAIEAGVNDFIAKPFSLATLKGKIEEA